MKKLLESQYAEIQKSIVMDSRTSTIELRNAIFELGCEIGKKILVDYFLSKAMITTPMNKQTERLLPNIPLCAIITTRDDFQLLGKGLSSVLDNSVNGYIDFEGRRGLEALNSEIREMELPVVNGESVHTLIIAKAVLATGCTATHLTRYCVSKYNPRNIIISSVFYCQKAVSELSREAPNADIIVVGDPDELDDNGMLVPGVGDLDKRLRA